MTINSDNSQPPARQGISITEAALRLGVSERTIYRMLREGKLQRIMSDISGRNVRLNAEQMDINAGHQSLNGKPMSDNLSDGTPDIALNELLKTLRQELREKDAQIERLIEQQRDMTAALNRLQDQMFELARLTLSQGMATVSPSQSPPLPTKAASEKRRWWQWWHRGTSP